MSAGLRFYKRVWLVAGGVSLMAGVAACAATPSSASAAPTPSATSTSATSAAPTRSATSAASPTPAAGTALQGDPVRGKDLYQNCTACHSIDDDDIGPRHRGVVGRKAGTVPGYSYSPALKASGITWDPATLNRWLINPSDLVPGTKMFFKIDDPQNRADIIAYLATLK